MVLHEECGVFGIISPVTADVAGTAYYGLYALQHRGQESCGIVVNDDGVFSSHNPGLAKLADSLIQHIKIWG